MYRSTALRLSDLGEEAIREIEPVNNNQFVSPNSQRKRAREILNTSKVPPKRWGQELGVSERFVQYWMNGGKKISDEKVKKILELGWGLLMEQRDAIDATIFKMLKDAYGPFVREDYNG